MRCVDLVVCLVESAVVASGLSLENGRLHADLANQLREVRASRTRIVEAAITERRRIERDLHDGAQQSLLAMATTLGVARLHSTGDQQALAAIDRARADLRREGRGGGTVRNKSAFRSSRLATSGAKQ